MAMQIFELDFGGYQRRYIYVNLVEIVGQSIYRSGLIVALSRSSTVWLHHPLLTMVAPRSSVA